MIPASPDAVIDLRSDLLSRPTETMIEEMARAARAPAAFGLREDRAQVELEALAAALLGKEDALLFPTCTMANQAALAILTRPGSRVITQADPHILTSEGGSPAALSGLIIEEISGDAAPAFDEWRERAERPSSELAPRATALVLENTHNRSGGVPLTAAYVRGVAALARDSGLRLHVDGARLPNAAVALGDTLAALADGADTVALSLTKALGCPFGALLAGSRELIAEALVVRQRLGGGIRPSGIVCAAAIPALRDMSHIADDHARAGLLARSIEAVMPGLVRSPPLTNIVMVELGPLRLHAHAVCPALEERGVLALPFGAARIRLVTYRGVDDVMVGAAAAIVARVVARLADAQRGAAQTGAGLSTR